MPISSGALDWPTSHFSKPDKEERRVGVREEDGIPGGTSKSPRGVPPQGYEWKPKLTNREEYEKWRKQMDRKDPLKTRRKKRDGCFGFMLSNKLNTENEDPTKGEQRDSLREVIKRRRRRRCFALACCVSLLSFLLMAVFVFVFLRFTGHETIGPEDLVECTGRWRTHFLAYAERATNGTTTYYCCYLPDIKNTTVWSVLSQDGWPDGYLVTQSDCTQPPTHSTCDQYDQTEFNKVAMPKVPCKAAGRVMDGWGKVVVAVYLTGFGVLSVLLK
ncbi:uncharacterized protein [Littorina saxatilis]|uniref:Uncharacterized protein n=1 Tax=Littorina saxatilis TaxID=31220 RepID=A0AAN9BW22_9CAEN